MTASLLDQLLATLDVRLHAFAVCEVRRGQRLVFDPMDAVIIHYVLAGDGLLEVDGSPPRSFGPGAILIVPAGRAQSLTAGPVAEADVPADSHCSMLIDGLVKFDAANGAPGDLLTICGSLSATYGGRFGLFDYLRNGLVEDLRDVPAVEQAFRLMAAERADPKMGTRALTEALMKQCLVLALRRGFERQEGPPALFADPRLARALMRVLHEPAGAHSVAQLAAAAGMSRSTFAKRFTEVFHVGPMEFVARTRLHHAAQLLVGTELPVKIIAASMGFRSRSHFSRSFRAAYGEDPTRFRRSRREATLDAPPYAP